MRKPKAKSIPYDAVVTTIHGSKFTCIQPCRRKDMLVGMLLERKGHVEDMMPGFTYSFYRDEIEEISEK